MQILKILHKLDKPSNTDSSRSEVVGHFFSDEVGGRAFDFTAELGNTYGVFLLKVLTNYVRKAKMSTTRSIPLLKAL